MDALALARMSCVAKPDFAEYEAAVIDFCARLGQLLEVHLPTHGFIAWFRVAREHIPMVTTGNFDAVQQLSTEELTTGPVMVVADAAGPRVAAMLMQEIRRHDGVEEILAYRRGRLRRRRVTRCRG
jgi:hypothetical protein